MLSFGPVADYNWRVGEQVSRDLRRVGWVLLAAITLVTGGLVFRILVLLGTTPLPWSKPEHHPIPIERAVEINDLRDAERDAAHAADRIEVEDAP